MKQKIVFALFMGIITTGIISFSMISINLGFSTHFTKVWFKSWIIAYLIVIPIILLISPKVQKLVSFLFRNKK